MTEAQRHQILLEMLAQLGFVRKSLSVWEFRLPLHDAISINLTKAAN